MRDALTLQHLATYAAFRGDADGWARPVEERMRSADVKVRGRWA